MPDSKEIYAALQQKKPEAENGPRFFLLLLCRRCRRRFRPSTGIAQFFDFKYEIVLFSE